MNSREMSLAQRRRALVERSEAQRTAILDAAAPLASKAVSLDRVVDYVRRYPVVAAAAVGALALVGPRRLFDLGTRALTLYMLLRNS
jgi:YqjK-like protein